MKLQSAVIIALSVAGCGRFKKDGDAPGCYRANCDVGDEPWVEEAKASDNVNKNDGSTKVEKKKPKPEDPGKKEPEKNPGEKPKVDVTYADVKKLLDDGSSSHKYCVKCHAGTKAASDLDLSKFPFTQGESTQKEIVRAMIDRMKDPDEPMPPKKANFGRMTKEDIAVFQSWLDGGLKP